MNISSTSICTLVLHGKSFVENEAAKRLRKNHDLKLPCNKDASIILRTEIDKQYKEDDFNMELFMDFLSTKLFGRFLIWSSRLSSTQAVISYNFCTLPIGAVCVADIQEHGRGRSNNAWESPPGCLMFSFSVQMTDSRAVPLLQYVVSLAIVEGIKDICKMKGSTSINIKIKWPNDLYINSLKVGGILCTSIYESKNFNVVIGVGLNIDNEKPSTCLNAVLRELSSPFQLRREDVAAAFFNKFEHLYNDFVSQVFFRSFAIATSRMLPVHCLPAIFCLLVGLCLLPTACSLPVVCLLPIACLLSLHASCLSPTAHPLLAHLLLPIRCLLTSYYPSAACPLLDACLPPSLLLLPPVVERIEDWGMIIDYMRIPPFQLGFEE